jgi:hypothetical protein
VNHVDAQYRVRMSYRPGEPAHIDTAAILRPAPRLPGDRVSQPKKPITFAD